MFIAETHSLVDEETDEVYNLLDTDKYPVYDPYNLENIFLMETIDDAYRSNHFETYTYKDIPVPRVSNILKSCIGNQWLIDWAAKIGKRNADRIRDNALTIGTCVHEMIEYYLINKKDKDIDFTFFDQKLYKQIITAYNNFKSWLYFLNSNGYLLEEIVAIEKIVTCPYYGGAIDCIAKINGKYYIIDFKTSKNISYEYILQTCAYMWIVNNGYSDLPFRINGIGIIRIDKSREGLFEDYFLNEDINSQKEIIDAAYNTFSCLLTSFYNIINLNILYYSRRDDNHLISK